MAPPTVTPSVVEDEGRVNSVALVTWSGIPVSPVTPLRVIVWVFPAGGTITTPVVFEGTVTLLKPDDRATTPSASVEVALEMTGIDIVLLPLGPPATEPVIVTEAVAAIGVP
jgi:hypothetical protein